MALYTLVNENKNTTNVINLFDRNSSNRAPVDNTPEASVVNTIDVITSLISSNKKQRVNLAFETKTEAQHYADILNQRIKGRRSRFIEHLYGTIECSISYSFSPNLISDEAEQRFRAGVQSGELDFNYKLIDRALNSQKWMIRLLVISACIISGSLINTVSPNFFAEPYHDVLSWYLEKQGTVYMRIYASDGLDSFGLTNNTADNPNLTQIPQHPLSPKLTYSTIDSSACQEYPAEIIFTYPDFKSGHYVFNAKLRDCKRNIEDRIYEFDINNPNGGEDKSKF